MPWIDTATISRSTTGEDMVGLQVYNGLDVCVTFECWERMSEDMETIPHSANAKLIYDFERGLRAPSFAMTARGVRVDRMWRGFIRADLQKELDICQARFDRLAEAVWDQGLNFNSPKQLVEFFYTTLNIPPIYKFAKGKSVITCDREALEKIEQYQYGGIFARFIIHMRKLKKLIDVLSKQLSADGRMRCSYNVAGTETGRWSSSESPMGDGDNLQNWTKKMRRCIIADPGKKLFSIDLAQAESFIVGGLGYRDHKYSKAYIEACKKGVHLEVAKNIWPDMAWTGDPEHDKENVAGGYFYHHHTYYDTTKRLGHGSNYYGKPFQMSKQTKIAENMVSLFQLKYFKSFPEIKTYHQMQSIRLQTDFYICTFFGRLRYFFGRPDDDATLRKAIAFDPQSTVGDYLNLGLWRVWNELDRSGQLELLLQVHDNIVFQVDDNPDDPYNEVKQERIVNRVLQLLETQLTYRDVTFSIPADVESGWNWATEKSYAKEKEKNPDGLRPWKGAGSDTRKRQADPSASGLDRSLL